MHSVILVAVAPFVAASVSAAQKAALVDIWKSTDGKNWNKQQCPPWNIAGDPCQSQWSGVYCNGDATQIT
jgi:hypothetical protein